MPPTLWNDSRLTHLGGGRKEASLGYALISFRRARARKKVLLLWLAIDAGRSCDLVTDWKPPLVWPL